ncbi:MAG: PAS domain-containing protein, partial [Methylomonas sp.]|nr:PAS domain-containing protein [Methylomonas sp.]
MNEELQSHLRFFENMDKVNRAIQGSNDLEAAMNDVLDTVISIFDCDRAFLCYPCDPEAESWHAPMERTRQAYPGAFALGGLVMPMDEQMAGQMRIALNSDDPVTFGSGNHQALPGMMSERFGFESGMAVAVYPKGDRVWLFEIHQCSCARVWTADEKKLLREIGRRLTDGLTSLLAYRDIQEREQKFRTLAESLPDNIARYDLRARLIYMNHRLELTFGVRAHEWLGKTPKEIYPSGEFDDYQAKIEAVISTGTRDEMELIMPDWIDGLRYYHVRFVAERGPNGKIIGALAMACNVSKKRQLELDLIRSEREFRTLAENSPDIIVRYDRDCRRTY